VVANAAGLRKIAMRKYYLRNHKVTVSELQVIADLRNKNCKQGKHLKLTGESLPNGRNYIFCLNCLWAELVDCQDLKIGKDNNQPPLKQPYGVDATFKVVSNERDG